MTTGGLVDHISIAKHLSVGYLSMTNTDLKYFGLELAFLTLFHLAVDLI